MIITKSAKIEIEINFLCEKCGDDLFYRFSKKNKTFCYITPCSRCLDKRYFEDKKEVKS